MKSEAFYSKPGTARSGWSIFRSPILHGEAFLAKFVRLVAILGKVRLSMKDRTVGDTEAATIFWMIVSILLGFWPTVNHAVLDYAPDQQIAILKGYKFCAPAYRPEVAAVKNGS